MSNGTSAQRINTISITAFTTWHLHFPATVCLVFRNASKKGTTATTSHGLKMQCLLLGHCTCLHPLPSPHLTLVLLIKANRRLKAICCPLLSKPRLHVDTGISSRKSLFSEQSPLFMQEMTPDGITQLWRGSLGAISSYDRWGRQIIRSLTRQLSIEGVLGMLVCSSRLNAVVREYKEIPPSVFCSHRHKRFRTEADHKAHKEKKKLVDLKRVIWCFCCCLAWFGLKPLKSFVFQQSSIISFHGINTFI